MKDIPRIAGKKPIAADLEKGKEYYYCTCGRSKSQPFCDGSHQGTSFLPQAFTAEKDGKAALCACKQTGNAPFCDGTHATLSDDSDGSEEAKSDRAASREVWCRVAGPGEVADGQTVLASAGSRQIALTRRGSDYGAIDNACPHQGGPLAEGALDEDGCLSCPWHGWKFDSFTGEGSNGHGVQSYPVEIRNDGIHVQVEEEIIVRRTVSDVMAQTMVNWGVTHVFGMVGHGRRVEQADDLSSAIQDALACEGPALVEVMTDSMLV